VPRSIDSFPMLFMRALSPSVRYSFLVLGLVAFAAAGCSGPLGLFSGPLEISIRGTTDMNGGNAARVRIYELAGDTNFQNTPVGSFWQSDRDALGDELVRPPREVLIYPGQNESVEFELAEDTQFIGVASDLRNPRRDGWRTVYPINDVQGERMVVNVGVDQITVAIE